MTDQQHPIAPPTPPCDLVKLWLSQWVGADTTLASYIATRAAQWGWVQRGGANEAELQQRADQGPEPLSPASQAVLDAVFDHWPGGYNHPGKPLCVAAALRALADQLRLELPLGDTDADAGVFAAHQAIRSEILAIATELENAQ